MDSQLDTPIKDQAGGGLAERRSEQAIAAEAQALLRQGARGREAAAVLLYRRLGGRLTAYLRRHRVPEAEAEELLTDILYKFIGTESTGSQDKSALALLWVIAERVLVDWVRRRETLRRGGGGQGGALEVTLDEEHWLSLLETSHGGFDLPAWVRECVHRAAALFQHEKPRQAELLLRHAEGYSHRELAVLLGTEPAAVTPHLEKAIKSRVHHACKLAREYFEECKE